MSIGRHRLTRVTLFGLGVLTGATLLLAAIAAGPAGAAEKPFALQFDESSIEAGFVGDLGLDALSGPSSIEGTVDESGNIKIPKGKFQLPLLDASAIAQSLIGIDLPVEIKGFMSVEQPATGTYDSETGKMEIQTKAGLWITINPQQLLSLAGGAGIDLGGIDIARLLGDELTCGFSPMDVTFTTESTSLGQGQRFTKGLDGPGGLSGEWSQLGPFAGKTKIFVIDVCSLIRSQLPTLISGLGGGAGIDLGGFDIAGLLAGLDDLDLGPSALTITRTLDESPPPKADARLMMRVAAKRLGSPTAGTSYRITVRNLGKSAASKARICAKAPSRAVLGSRCVRLGTIASGKSKRASFRLRLKRNAPRSAYRVTFRVRASGGISSVRTARLTRGSR